MLAVSTNKPAPPLALTCHQQILPLDDEHEAHVFSFVSARPSHTFVRSSWIRDNGLASSLNRGTFYGYRDANGRLEGVALIGHITLFEAEADSALAAFANLTQSCPSAHTVLSEQKKISQFLSHYTKGGAQPRLVCRESLMDKRTPENVNTVQSLRTARSEEIELVVTIHAQTAFDESGVNPLEVNPSGFRERCARRIKQGRTWVAIEGGRLRFKIDVVSDTPEVVYLEGAYVSAE